MTVTGGHNSRVSVAALIAIKPRCRSRLIYRGHRSRGKGRGKGFTEAEYARIVALQPLPRNHVTKFALTCNSSIPVVCADVVRKLGAWNGPKLMDDSGGP